jgi:hypothetical protein
LLKLFDTWLESMRFACEMQSVISMRMMHLAQGGPHAAAEASRMIAEKIDAFAEAETVLVNALSRGEEFLIAAERSYTSVRRRVRANSRRLSGCLSPADGIPETLQ